MNTENRIKVSVLRILALTLVLCAVSVATFSFSEILVDKALRGIDVAKDTNKNVIWLLGHIENLLLLPAVALVSSLVYRRSEDAKTNAVFHKEKKIAFSLLFVFVYFVFLPYYVTQNTAGDMTFFEVISDKVIWFATQMITLSAMIMYHSDREKKYALDVSEGKGEI